MSEQTRKTVLITGASSGIGEAFAQVFLEAGFNLVITARRMNRLEDLKVKLLKNSDARIDLISMDLSKLEAPKYIHQYCVDNEIHIDALVNNAGYGNTGKFEEMEWERHQNFLQVMVNTIVELTYLFLPSMVNNGYGRIINVASLAPFIPSPDMAGLYSPVKIFQIKFSESIHLQYLDKGIHCSAVCPGLTRTEFHIAAGMDEVAKAPKWLWMDSKTVARQGLDAVMNGKMILINGRLNKFFAILAKIIPQSISRSIARTLTKRAY
ncbi:MAG: SDR family oxidoreductase [Gammaproteobacteria bacterium]|nr:SDR family oxidoreductase [Gammaproteobacteria bacterium]MBT6074595.1 SDR family oxidoreductase [Gammaproteobacteria bacterium]